MWLSFDRLYSNILRFDEYSSKIDSFCRKYHRPYIHYIWTKTLHRMNFQRNKRWATNWHICIDHQLAKLCDANVRHVFATLHLIGVTFSITFPKLSLHTFSFWISFCCAHLSHNRMLLANICAHFGYSVFRRWFYLRSNFNILIRSIFLVTIVIDSLLSLSTRSSDRVYQIIEKVKLEWIPPFPLVNSIKPKILKRNLKKALFPRNQ